MVLRAQVILDSKKHTTSVEIILAIGRKNTQEKTLKDNLKIHKRTFYF